MSSFFFTEAKISSLNSENKTSMIRKIYLGSLGTSVCYNLIYCIQKNLLLDFLTGKKLGVRVAKSYEIVYCILAERRGVWVEIATFSAHY